MTSGIDIEPDTKSERCTSGSCCSMNSDPSVESKQSSTRPAVEEHPGDNDSCYRGTRGVSVMQDDCANSRPSGPVDDDCSCCADSIKDADKGEIEAIPDAQESDCHENCCSPNRDSGNRSPESTAGDNCSCCSEAKEEKPADRTPAKACSVKNDCSEGCCAPIPSPSLDDSCSCCSNSENKEDEKETEVSISKPDPGTRDDCSCCSGAKEGNSVHELPNPPCDALDAEDDCSEGCCSPNSGSANNEACECCLKADKEREKEDEADDVNVSIASAGDKPTAPLTTPSNSIRRRRRPTRDCCETSSCCNKAERTRSRLRPHFHWRRNQRLPCCSSLDNYPSTVISSSDSLKPEAEEKALKLFIGGMDCPACTPRVERVMKSLGLADVNVDYVGAWASCKYMTDIHDPESIRKKVASATGFLCTIANIRHGERTLRLSFAGNLAPPTLTALQTFFGGEQLIEPVSKTDFRFIIDRQASKNVYAACLERGWQVTPVNDDDDREAADRALSLDLRWSIGRLILSIILTVPVLVLAWSPGFEEHLLVRGSVALAFATLILGFGAGQIITGAIRTVVVYHLLDADVLISLSSLSAYLYSVVSYAYNVATRSTALDSYFETSSLLITLILFGRLVSTYTVTAARRSASTLLTAPPQVDIAHIYNTQTLQTQDIHTALLDAGDIVLVYPGELVPSDGTVTRGTAEVDESLITGEALPVLKSPGAQAIAGTHLLGSSPSIHSSMTSLAMSTDLHIRLTKPTQSNTLASLRRLAAEARSSRAPIQDLADRVAGYLVPLALLASSITFLAWGLALRYARGTSPGAAVAGALGYAVAVLALSCPCALALCVPLVVLCARRVCERRGVLVPGGGAVLQVARGVKHVVFDKTGTLTTGRMRVVEATMFGSGGSNGEALVCALVDGIEHPVAGAVGRHLSASVGSTEIADLADRQIIAGKGIQASLGGSILRGGSASWCNATANSAVAAMIEGGKSVFVVTLGDVPLAAFGLEDDLRPESVGVVGELLRCGIRVSILSGDHQRAVDAICARLQTSPGVIEAKGGCSPEEKRDFVRMASWGSVCKDEEGDIGSIQPIRSRGIGIGYQKESIVMFVGDGSNDTAALSQADVGVSLASGTTIAMGAADVIIVSGGLRGVLKIMGMSGVTWRRIVMGLAWAVLYNMLAVVLGSGMLVVVRVEPRWAGLGEFASVAPVVMLAYSVWWMKGDFWA